MLSSYKNTRSELIHVNRFARNSLFKDLMECCSRHGELSSDDKAFVCGIVRHKMLENKE